MRTLGLIGTALLGLFLTPFAWILFVLLLIEAQVAGIRRDAQLARRPPESAEEKIRRERKAARERPQRLIRVALFTVVIVLAVNIGLVLLLLIYPS